ncbi:hypothetical protein [Diaminobutyricibacter sp. McL0608]|uniref:hypothetical protein n=1 Tax=Leifsonia sp. McL0608 TaxID=3143537 RepID=UPI0031F3284A
MAADRVALARDVITYGTTEADIALTSGPSSGGLLAAPYAPTLVTTQHDLAAHWPPGTAPSAHPPTVRPGPGDPLPQADYVVITWTVPEQQALVDVLAPGVKRTEWIPYARNWETVFKPFIRPGAPSLAAGRMASYMPVTVAGKSVLVMKSELHLNQDGMHLPDGSESLPVADLFAQIIDEAKPKLIITTGTAGGTMDQSNLGDVMVTRAARFRCRSEFKGAPFADSAYASDFDIPTGRLADATTLMQLHAAHLTEPAMGPATERYNDGTVVPGFPNTPKISVEGVDFAAGLPILTTDYFEFGTSTNKLGDEGCGVEMGDAVLGMVCAKLGATAPRWLVVRNASDPQINGHLPTDPDVQAMWAVWFYAQYGYWTSVSSALACWAIVVDDKG